MKRVVAIVLVIMMLGTASAECGSRVAGVVQTIKSFFSLVNMNINLNTGCMKVGGGCTKKASDTTCDDSADDGGQGTVEAEPEQPEECGVWHWVVIHSCDMSVGRIRVHQSADFASPVIGTVDEGAQVEVLEYSHGLVRIRYRGGFGWISADNVTRDISQAGIRYDVSVSGETFHIWNKAECTIWNTASGQSMKVDDIEVTGLYKSFMYLWFEYDGQVWYTGLGNVHDDARPASTVSYCTHITRGGTPTVCGCVK